VKPSVADHFQQTKRESVRRRRPVVLRACPVKSKALFLAALTGFLLDSGGWLTLLLAGPTAVEVVEAFDG
jgi:hypothetical protein